jgi:hypothetical protein
LDDSAERFRILRYLQTFYLGEMKHLRDTTFPCRNVHFFIPACIRILERYTADSYWEVLFLYLVKKELPEIYMEAYLLQSSVDYSNPLW